MDFWNIKDKKEKRGNFKIILPNNKIVSFKYLEQRAEFCKYYNGLRGELIDILNKATKYANDINMGLVNY